MVRKIIVLAVMFFTLALCLAACAPERAHEVKLLKVAQGADQYALPGETFPLDLRIIACGPEVRGVGGKVRSDGVPGAVILLTPAEGSDLTIEPARVETDITGTVSVRITAGKKVGDNYIRVIPAGFEDRSILVRVGVGAKLSGGEQEGWVNSLLPDPLSIRLVRPDGGPASHVPVYFSVIASPEDVNTARVLTRSAVTDDNGVAQTHVQLGGATGEYRIAVEVADPKSGYFMRLAQMRVLGIDLVTVIIGVIGGLAFFIFGMQLMAEGLQQIAGENMKKFLQYFSRNGLVAVLAGTVVTAVIQSSSATTVMVIGFINAGLLTLRQSIGIIFGANIGTTVTAQIISFNLSGLALPAVAVGFLVMVSKNRVVRGWGSSILGFGLIFFGMSMMSNELRTLGTFPSFVNFFRLFDCAPHTYGGFMPLGAVLGAIGIGMLATFLIQSSAAAVGIILALSAGGLVNFYTAVPLLIGTNIGTTITAWLASLGANRVAKQSALAHFLFNVIGALLMVILFYVPCGEARTSVFLYFVNMITPGNAFAPVPQNIERHIAMAHTLFNIVTVIALFPFMGWFAHLCEWILPVHDEASLKTHTLEPLLLKTPSVALEQTVVEIRKMVSRSWKMIDRVVNSHFLSVNVDADAFRELREQEQKIDDMQTAITNYLVQITRRPLTQHQSDLIPLLMHCTNDAERIADHTENIMKLTKRMAKANAALSDVAKADLARLWELLNSQANNVRIALAGTDKESVLSALKEEKKINKLAKRYEKDYMRNQDTIRGIDPAQTTLSDDAAEAVGEEISTLAMENEEEINQLTKRYEQSHIERRNEGKCAVEASVIFIEMLWELERIGDHLANIAVRAPEIQKHYFAMK